MSLTDGFYTACCVRCVLTFSFSRLPVRWHNKSIFVLDSVLIEPPYGVEDCKAPAKNAKQLERVRELVRNEQERMQKDNTLGRRGG